MAAERSLNDLVLQIQETNIRLNTLSETGEKQETHLSKLAKMAKGDNLQDLEDARESKSAGQSSNTVTTTKADKDEGFMGVGLMRPAIFAGISALITGMIAGVAGLFTVGGLLAIASKVLKTGLVVGLITLVAGTAIQAVFNYFGKPDLWKNAANDVMAGNWNPASLGFVGGAATGAAIGLKFGGVRGMVFGGLVGSALGAFGGDMLTLPNGSVDKMGVAIASAEFAGGSIGFTKGMKFGKKFGLKGMILGGILGLIIGSFAGSALVQMIPGLEKFLGVTPEPVTLDETAFNEMQKAEQKAFIMDPRNVGLDMPIKQTFDEYLASRIPEILSARELIDARINHLTTGRSHPSMLGQHDFDASVLMAKGVIKSNITPMPSDTMILAAARLASEEHQNTILNNIRSDNSVSTQVVNNLNTPNARIELRNAMAH